jgi:HD-GYP domain-containing protein (c-di-GMP phosphodiesterase class II)
MRRSDDSRPVTMHLLQAADGSAPVFDLRSAARRRRAAPATTGHGPDTARVDDRDRLLRDLGVRLTSPHAGWTLLVVEVAPTSWAAIGEPSAIDAWAERLPVHSPYGTPPYRVSELRFACLVPPPEHDLDRRPAELRAAVTHTLIAHGLRGARAEVHLGAEAATVDAVLRLAELKLTSRWERHELSPRRQARGVLLALVDEVRRRHPDAMRNVALFSIAAARRLRVPDDELEDIVRAAELQEIGKLTLPRDILDKDGPLTDAEWQVVRQHPVIGERIVGAAPALAAAARLIRSSYERFDGSGYPDGLAGDEIPLGSRIIAVSVGFAAMLSRRPYRPALSWERAAAELCAGRGSQFDPEVVDAFLGEVVGEGPPSPAALSVSRPAGAPPGR